MRVDHFSFRVFAFVAGLATLACSGWASADPPSRVARLGHVTGDVSFSPAGESDWVRATVNRPLTTGDRLWTDAGARAEIQVGGAMIRMDAATSVSVLNLDDSIAQLQLTQGTLNVRALRLAPNQSFEVATPNLAFTLRQPGAYRIEVDPDGNATTIVVRKGQGDVYGEGAAYVVDSRQPYRFTGTGLREYSYVDAPRFDDFDRWSSDRDRSYDNSRSARYVSPDVIGYQDLDANGTWRIDASYGNVWVPNRVAAGWAPYRDGHWAWVDPWGWTWMDDAPWGFAVSHYGRWANLGGTWGWVPGPVRARAYYAPALVAFVGGDNFRLTISGSPVGGVAWFALGPREVYRPSYPVSRGYFENVNRSNTVVTNTVINNYYNNTNVTNVVYANRQVPGAVVAVPRAAFVDSHPVSAAAVRVSREMIVGAPVAFVAPIAPTAKSVQGAATRGEKPPARVFERPVVVRTAPPAAAVGLVAQQQQLAAHPGRPLDQAARKDLKPAADVPPAPVVKVVAETRKAPPTLRPPTAAAASSQDGARGTATDRRATGAPAVSAPSAIPKPGAGVVQGAPAAPGAQAPEQRGKSEPRDTANRREQPVAAPPAPPQRAGEPKPKPVTPPIATSAPPQKAIAPKSIPPEAAPPAPAAQPQPPRGKVEPRGNAEQRAQQPVAAPPAPARRAVEKSVKPPAAVSAPPAPQAAPQRSVPPRETAAPHVAPPAPAAPQATPRKRPEPTPAPEKAQPRPPAAAPVTPPSRAPAVPKAKAPEPKAEPSAVTPSKKKKGDAQETTPESAAAERERASKERRGGQ